MGPPSYGHMHLSIFFREILELRERGFIFKRKAYPWSAIHHVETWQEPWPGWGYVPDAKLLPRARVNMSDGTSFLLRGDALVKRGAPLSAGFISAFDELVSHLRKMKQRK